MTFKSRGPADPPKPFFSFVLILIAFLLISVPAVSAAHYTLTGYQEFNVFDIRKDSFTGERNISFDKSNEDKAITLIHFKVPMDHQVDFTIYYGAGNSVSGSAITAWNTSLLPLQTTTSTLVFDGITKEYSYLDTNPEFDYYLSGYARSDENNETGIIVYSAGYGAFDNDLAVFKAVPNMAGNLIYKVELTSDTEFDADITYGSASEVAKTVSKDIFGVIGDWVDFAIGIASLVFGIVSGLFAWLRFFFIDNLIMTVSLYLAITMAYSAATSKNIFKFFGKFFSDQRKLFEFILGLWRALIEIIASFRGIFRL